MPYNRKSPYVLIQIDVRALLKILIYLKEEDAQLKFY